MTPQKKNWLLDERLLQSQKLAALGQLSAGMAHEINNPLAIIRQEAEWMQQVLKKAESVAAGEREELNGSLRQIVQQAARTTEIIRNLLDFARQREPVIQTVDVNRLLNDMTMLVEKEARHHNIKIVREYDRNLPAIYSDAPQLRQVFLNLLTNAAHAIGQDGTITITTNRKGDGAIRILISDTGSGITPENLKNIFRPFFTTKTPGDRPAGSDSGSGVGLAFCRRTVEAHGGEITVQSQIGQGSTFTIRLPRMPMPGDR